MKRRIIAVLIVALLLVALLPGVPIARATTIQVPSPYYVFGLSYAFFDSTRTDTSGWSGLVGNVPGDLQNASGTYSFTFNGHAIAKAYCFYGGTWPYNLSDAYYGWVVYASELTAYGYGDSTVDTWSYSFDLTYVVTADVTLHYAFSGTGSGIARDTYFGSFVPLSLSLSGPSTVDLVNGGTWTATATGGTPPYTYYWQQYPLGGTAPYNTPFDPVGPVGTDSYSHTWTTAGTYVVDCMVQDAAGTWQGAWKQVNAASVIGNYHALFIRYGDLGQYVNVQVFDSSGNPVTISSTAGTQYGQYGQSGGFAWYTADYEAVQTTGGSYTWKWTMAFTVGGIQLHPDADMWFQTDIHLAIPNIDLQVMHHWTGLGQSWDAWYGPTGNQLIPETPPTVTSTIPEWLQAVYDMFVRLFRYLFVPSSSDFSSQLASGWILITSPVPSISPQYTIPFPNPNHLLAATGDSINIDFSGIQSYSGYSTYKTIVQAYLDALLVFAIISLVA